jgi:hypothetical protein
MLRVSCSCGRKNPGRARPTRFALPVRISDLKQVMRERRGKQARPTRIHVTLANDLRTRRDNDTLHAAQVEGDVTGDRNGRIRAADRLREQTPLIVLGNGGARPSIHHRQRNDNRDGNRNVAKPYHGTALGFHDVQSPRTGTGRRYRQRPAAGNKLMEIRTSIDSDRFPHGKLHRAPCAGAMGLRPLPD